MEQEPMTTAEKKKHLQQYQRWKKEYQLLKMQFEEMQHIGISSHALDSVGGSGKGINDLSMQLCYIEELEYKVEKKKKRMLESFCEIAKYIDNMDDVHEKQVLSYRYLLDMPWCRIQDIMGYSDRQIHRIHGSALLHYKIL